MGLLLSDNYVPDSQSFSAGSDFATQVNNVWRHFGFHHLGVSTVISWGEVRDARDADPATRKIAPHP